MFFFFENKSLEHWRHEWLTEWSLIIILFLFVYKNVLIDVAIIVAL